MRASGATRAAPSARRARRRAAAPGGGRAASPRSPSGGTNASTAPSRRRRASPAIELRSVGGQPAQPALLPAADERPDARRRRRPPRARRRTRAGARCTPGSGATGHAVGAPQRSQSGGRSTRQALAAARAELLAARAAQTRQRRGSSRSRSLTSHRPSPPPAEGRRRTRHAWCDAGCDRMCVGVTAGACRSRSGIGLGEAVRPACPIVDASVAGHAPAVHGLAAVEPLDEAARLVGLVALGEVLGDERQVLAVVEVERDRGERRRRLARASPRTTTTRSSASSSMMLQRASASSRRRRGRRARWRRRSPRQKRDEVGERAR